MNLYHVDRRRKVWGRKETGHDLEHATVFDKSCQTQCWQCYAMGQWTGSLLFIDHLTADRSSRMKSEVYMAILCPYSGKWVSQGMKWKILYCPISHLISYWSKNSRQRYPQTSHNSKWLNAKAWQNISKEEMKNVMISMVPRLHAIIVY